MKSRRPVNRLKDEFTTGSGKAQVVDSPSQLSHILWAANKGETGKRNVALIWMLFGSGLRINECAQLKIKDIYFKNGELKQTFSLPGGYTKTGNSRTVFILVQQQREALERLRVYRLQNRVMISSDGSYGGLSAESPLFLSLKGKHWRKFSFNDKRYKDAEGNIKTTKVCGSLENLARELIKKAGIHGGSSHSGRRSLATWMDRRGYSLNLIQYILGHSSTDMTLIYIDPWEKRIKNAFETSCSSLKVPEFI